MEVHKNAGFKKKVRLVFIVPAAVLAVVIVFLVLLLHKPAYYQPLDFAAGEEVSLYLTNELLPELYNGAQLQEPFDLVVTQRGINDIVAHSKWPQEFGSVKISEPMVFFSPGSIVLVGQVVMEGAELVATIVGQPAIDTDGLLNLQGTSVSFGAVDVTPLARVLTRRICQQQFAAHGIDANDVQAQIAASVLDGVPFKPVFKIEDKKVRVDKVTIEPKKLTIHFVPASD